MTDAKSINIQTLTAIVGELKTQRERLSYLCDHKSEVTGEATAEDTTTLLELFTTDDIQLEALTYMEPFIGEKETASRVKEIQGMTFRKALPVPRAIWRIHRGRVEEDKIFCMKREMTIWLETGFVPSQDNVCSLLKDAFGFTKRTMAMMLRDMMGVSIPADGWYEGLDLDVLMRRLSEGDSDSNVKDVTGYLRDRCTRPMQRQEVEMLLHGVQWSVGRAMSLVRQKAILDRLVEFAYITRRNELRSTQV